MAADGKATTLHVVLLVTNAVALGCGIVLLAIGRTEAPVMLVTVGAALSTLALSAGLLTRGSRNTAR